MLSVFQLFRSQRRTNHQASEGALARARLMFCPLHVRLMTAVYASLAALARRSHFLASGSAAFACVSLASAQPTPKQYVADRDTALLYHLNDCSGATARDSSENARHAGLGEALQVEVRSVPSAGGAPGFLEHSLRTTTPGDASITWVDTGSGRSSFLFPRAHSSLTIEGWFKLERHPTDAGALLFAVRPVDARVPTREDYALELTPGLQEMPSGTRRGLSLLFRDAHEVRLQTESFNWEIGEWNHIAVVIETATDQTRYTLYRTPLGYSDAVASKSSEGALTLDGSRADRLISFVSRFGSKGQDRFPGSVDELRVSTKVRSPEELRLTIAPSLDDTLRSAATAPNSEVDHALPLASSWDTGKLTNPKLGEGYTPAWQLEMISQGHHILPAFAAPEPLPLDSLQQREAFRRYYEGPLVECARRSLPLSFPGTQWEIYLASEQKYLRLPYRSNPNAISTKRDRKVTTFVDPWQRTRGKLSPLGPLKHWRAVGRLWGSSEAQRKLQEWYPDPPKVILISNNEAPRVNWYEVESDQHYQDYITEHFGRNITHEQKLRLLSNSWIARYRALQHEWRRSLLKSPQPGWGRSAIFIAYGAFRMSQMGRWAGWQQHSPGPRRSDDNARMWDGAMVSGYLMPGRSLPVGRIHYPTDYWVFSPQVDYMNDEYHRREALRINPDFWLELGVWNGDDHYPVMEEKLLSFEPAYTPVRYGGMVQFGMWILRPRVVRDFRAGLGRKFNQVYFDQVLRAVDRVHTHPVLHAYWKDSELVPNRAQPHPYAENIPAEVAPADRMFMLDVDINPRLPWSVFTELQVFALARVKGEAPQRSWLVYAQAPRAGDSTLLVRVRLPAPLPSDPDHTIEVNVNASTGGSFSLIHEHGHEVLPI